MHRNLALAAIDKAFEVHIERLFERLASGIENEAAEDPARLARAVTPSAAAVFKASFDFAVKAHVAAQSHIDSLGDIL